MSGYGTFETCRPAVTMFAPEGRPEVMGRPANAYLGVFLGVMADSCFQDHCSTLRSRLRSISRACRRDNASMSLACMARSSACPEPINCELSLLFRRICPVADAPLII